MSGEIIGLKGVKIPDLQETTEVRDSNYMILVDEETGRTYKVKREHIKAQKTSELVDDVGFLRAIPDEYMTESEVREFTDAEIAQIREVLTNLENAKGTIDSNLNVYGDIKLFNTERVSNSEGDTILSSSESGKFIYFRPGGVNNKNGQVVLKENEFVVENGLVVSGNGVLNDVYLKGVSKSDNGYTKLPNGLIMQWATSNLPPTDETSIYLPISFPNKILSMYATPRGNRANGVWSITWWDTEIIKVWNGSNIEINYYVLAIGY